MAKNSTLFSNAFISRTEKNLKEKPGSDDQYSPSESVLNNILNFAKALKVVRVPEVGLIEVVLN